MKQTMQQVERDKRQTHQISHNDRNIFLLVLFSLCLLSLHHHVSMVPSIFCAKDTLEQHFDSLAPFLHDNENRTVHGSNGTSSIALPQLKRLIKPPPRNQTAVICAVMKEEEPYIDEWVDFHLGIGFDAIYLYDNSDNHDMEQWARERQQVHGDSVFVTHFPGKARQNRQNRRCAEKVKNLNHTWVAIIDIDEFIVIKNRTQFPHIVDLLKVYATSGRLHVWWRNFGTSGREVYEPIPVTKRFQYRVQTDYKLNHQYKSIVHIPDLDWSKRFSTPHWFPVKKGAAVVDSTGRWPDQRKSVGPDNVIALYHYQWKSFGELNKNKRARGDSWYGTNKNFVETAKNRQTQRGDPLPNGTIFDDTAWLILTRVAPRYSVYNAFDVQPRDFVPDAYNRTWAKYT